MSDDYHKRKENKYFYLKELEALQGLSHKESARLSPVSGQPMQTLMYGEVEIDVCQESGGVWLDQGELEKIIEHSQKEQKAGGDWFSSLKEIMGV